ncbi:serine/threonine-protein kinase [Psychromicrobium xiongbiense]|uniref:serine/threonine-protein kinase n=1 Tax=Psychromicrobium xiongbiense TaxID=3051184 RepID=UPI00255381BA|nr:serine/threonine-protein kinase [Psychromicrobium sp. YIM S02556]
MSSKRQHSAPPDIPGYRYLSLLGSGGFSDVFLYEQDRPRRKVAVKVLFADLKTESARRRFESEANLMAQLSTHPYIVTIYEAEVTESGHSYLAMEYCSRPSLDVRYRRAKFSVDEVLAIGIQVSSAVETAHRAGIAHRDIKPANILVTDYNRPALTDFGISGTMDAGPDEDAGMSIPWSPPESFTGGGSDGVRVDVWALGATLYTLLAGRSPFVMPGSDNSQRALISRISNSPLPALGRADVPESLELVLATAMSKSPLSRYASAQDFARALRRVQNEMGFSLTPFEVQDDVLSEDTPGSPSAGSSSDDETRVRSILSIDPEHQTGRNTGSSGQFGMTGRSEQTTDPFSTHQRTDHYTIPGQTTGRGPEAYQGAAPGTGTSPAPMGAPSISNVPGLNAARAQGLTTAPQGWTPHYAQPGAMDPLDDTVTRGSMPQAAQAEAQGQNGAQQPRRGPGKLIAVIASALVLVIVVVVIVVIAAQGGASSHSSQSTGAQTPPPAALIPGTVPKVTDLKPATKADGSPNIGQSGTVWTWTNPDPKDGDRYQWASASALGTGDYTVINTTTIFVQNNAQGQSCVSVKLVRKDGSASDENRQCAPVQK